MSDPPRLLQTPSTEADLLEAWSSMRGPADGRAKALALAGLTVGAATAAGASAVGASAAAKGAVAGTSALGAAATATATAGAGTAVASAGIGLVAAKWIAAIGVVAVVGGGSVLAAKRLSAPAVSVVTPAASTIAPVVAPPTREATLPAPAPAPTAAVDVADLPAVPARPARPAAPRAEEAPRGRGREPIAAEPAPPEPAPVASTLGAEVSALDAARNALRGGDPARALRELDAFDAKHPSSALAEDAAFLRFDANVALGDRAGADRAARSFLARYPSSPRAAKVRRWLDSAN
ncbi:MAG: outer membrane protein assembly factor BamD [Labilithrix sp.]